MENIYYTRRVKGVSVPGIIHNNSYFYTKLSVYEDGMVDCWRAVDLEGLRIEMEKGWVVPQVPYDRQLSIHGIGTLEIQEARWLYDKESFYEHIVNLIKQMNPELKNLHEIQANERINEKYSFAAAPGTPYREEGKIFKKTINGSQQAAFYRKDGGLYMTELSVYEDKRFRIDMEDDRLFCLEEITDMIQADILYSYPVEGEWLSMPALGDIKVRFRPHRNLITKEERVKEIEQLCARIAGEDDAAQRCIAAYHDYLEWPTEQKRERLKQLYLEVPEHERMYLGDMDVKDGDYIRIIYHPEKKRQV